MSMVGCLVSYGDKGVSFVLPNLAHSIICRAEQLGGLGRQLQPVWCKVMRRWDESAGGTKCGFVVGAALGKTEGVLKNTCGPTKEELPGNWRKLHN